METITFIGFIILALGMSFTVGYYFGWKASNKDHIKTQGQAIRMFDFIMEVTSIPKPLDSIVDRAKYLSRKADKLIRELTHESLR